MILKNDDLLKVMSFNLKNAYRKKGPNIWEKRRDMAASIFEFHQVVVSGLQEALIRQINDLEDRLPDYDWLGVGRDDGKNEGEFNPIFYRKDRLQVKKNDTFWLAEKTDEPGKMGWDAACSRIVTWARFLDKKTGQEFYFFNTHFDHEGQEAQKKSAVLLLAKIDDIAGDLPVIVTGDFNVQPSSEPYHILTDSRNEKSLQDSKSVAVKPHHGPDSTFHGFKGLDNQKQENRIDYIFVKNGVKVLQEGVLCDRLEGRYVSDHFPVLAKIKFS